MIQTGMTTSSLAAEVGISTQQVRDYEAQGMLPPVPRAENGYRQYTARHLDALRIVRSMIRAGYRGYQVQAVMTAVERGDLEQVFAVVDARHAGLAARRQQVNQVTEALQSLTGQPVRASVPARSRNLRIGEAAEMVGVRASTLRHWEREGLLQPRRDGESGYRIYDPSQMRRLEIVIILRSMSYPFDAIRSVLDDLARANPATTLKAIQRRRQEILEQSQACAEATAMLWAYIKGDARVVS